MTPGIQQRLTRLLQPGPRGILLGACLWILGLRALFVLHSGSTIGLHWALIADGAAVALVLLLLPHLRHLVVVATVALVFAFAYYIGGEHVHTHGTLFRPAHVALAFAPEFASTMAMRAGMFLAAYLAWTLAGLAWLGRAYRHAPFALGSTPKRGVLAILLVVGYFLGSPNITHPANNVVLASLAQTPGVAWRTTARESEPHLGLGQTPDEVDYFLTERSPLEDSVRPNVLVLVVEALSGAYLPSVARHHGVDPVLQLPRMDRMLQRHGFRTYLNTINMQRQTHRGTYPLLCGDYPRITTSVPKMTSIAERGIGIRCLPSLLSDAGYYTLYYQAAYLRFMDKDAFMPAAGFDVSVGREDLERLGLDSGDWGPGDEVFYDAAGDALLALEGRYSPWFSVLLNVGTHNPYTADTDSERRAERPDPAMRQQAFDTMAKSVERLLDRLDADGVLDDTLVLIVSDESGGVTSADGEEQPLGRNWGMLAVRAPDDIELDRFAPAEAITAQVDVPVTVLDAAGMSTDINMIGRSLLHRSSSISRGLLFGDTYGARTYFLRESGELIDCGETVLRCNTWTFDPERLFGSLSPQPYEDPELGVAERLRLVADASIIRDVGAHEGQALRHAPQLIEPGSPRRRELPIDVAKGHHVDLGLRLRQLDDQASGGTLAVVIRGRDSEERVVRSTISIEPGETAPYKLNFTAPASTPLEISLRWQPEDGESPLALLELSAEVAPGN